jgi:hypothetical protein
MLKKIALGGFFLLASAFTFSAGATTSRHARPTSTDSAPKAPEPRGLCPGNC